MLATQIFAAIAALTSTASALTVRNKHVADFRLFGAQGCSQRNEGIWTVIDDDFKPDECKSLNGLPATSILNVNISPGCQRKSAVLRNV